MAWSVEFSAQVDEVRGLEWRSRHRYTFDASPSGPYTSFDPWIDDSQAYGPKSITGIPGDVASVSIQVNSEWSDDPGDSGGVTVDRPQETECEEPTTTPPTTTPPTTTPPTTTPPTTTPPTTTPPTTTPPTTTPPTTTPPTTTPPTTTPPTTEPPCQWDPELPPNDPDCVEPCEYNPDLPANSPDCTPPPCEYNPDLPAGHPDCDPPVCEYDSGLTGDDPDCQPVINVTALCREYTLIGGNQTIGYWYDIENTEDVPVTLTYLDGGGGSETINLVAGETARVRVDSTTPQMLFEGSAIETPLPSSDCELEVEIAKQIIGPPPGDAEYTIQIAYYDDGVETVFLTFELSSQQPETIVLPASYSDQGGEDAIEYVVREVGPNQGTTVAYSPSNRFFGSGNIGEKVAVVITNAYSAVVIEKTVNDDVVDPGQIIFYELRIRNSGGLPIENIDIDDLFPPTILYRSYEIVGAGLPITCSDTPTPNSPDYFACDVTGVLQPGESLPTIRVTAEVAADAAPNDHYDNQSRVIADFVVPGEGSQAFGFRGSFGESRPVSFRAAPSPTGAPPPTNLTCAPVEGQVCNVSPRVIATGLAGGPTTTVAASGEQPTTTAPGELPATGLSDRNELVLAGLLLLLAGAGTITLARGRGRPA